MSKKQLNAEKSVPVMELYETYRDNLGREVSDDNVRAVVAALLTLAEIMAEQAKK